MQMSTPVKISTNRNYSVNLRLSYNKVDEIIDYVNTFIERVYIERRWRQLNVCQAYNVDLDFKKTVNDKNAMFINRFNKSDRLDAPKYDYFGMRGEPLREMLPEWDEKARLFNDLGLKQLVDSPCILVTNGWIVLHRDRLPNVVPGYSNRHVGVNYLLFDNSIFLTGVWDETEETASEKWDGLEHTEPKALIKYDNNSMNMINTSLPHGSFIPQGSEPSEGLFPRAFITMGFTCTYEEAREKVSSLVNFDW